MIRLNLSTDYALRTLLLLASRPGERLTVRDVAAYYRISVDHVSKVAGSLVRAGWVRGERGRAGGLHLAVDPADLSVGDVVERFEGRVALLECVNRDGVCVIEPVCKLRRVLAAAGDMLIRELKNVTLDQIAGINAGGLVQVDEGMGQGRPEKDGSGLAARSRANRARGER